MIDRTLTFKRQLHKMAKHTQTIRRLLPTNCLGEFAHSVGLALKGIKCGMHADTVIGGVLQKLLLKILQYSQENNCVGVSF